MRTQPGLIPDPLPPDSLEVKLQALYSRNAGRICGTETKRIRAGFIDFLARLGDPHLRLPPVIHVAGTNGKGSAIALLRAIFERAGLKVHVFTSPHLLRFNERIVIAGQEISNPVLESLLDEALAACEGEEMAFFEITTALAFLAFARTPADIVLLETGLGGRLDCTNVIPRPLASVITAIAYDHMDYLGDTLPAIAAEKAGIIKPGAPCVIARQPYGEETAAVLSGHARTVKSPCYREGKEWRVFPDEDENGFSFSWQNETPIHFRRPALPGRHQFDNAGVALAALKAIEPAFVFAPKIIDAAMNEVKWPGRLQILAEDKDGWEVWLDGGHNEGAGHALAEQARLWAEQDGKPLHLVLGMMGRKDPAAFAAPLVPYLRSLSALDMSGEPGGLSSADLLGRLVPLAIAQLAAATAPKEACVSIKRAFPHQKGRILITGSLYLAGRVLKEYQS